MEIDQAKLFAMFVRDEGQRRTPYDDATGLPVKAPKGNLTIGVGRNLDAKPLSNQILLAILEEDARDAYRDASDAVGAETWKGLSENRKLGLLNLAFNLGLSRLLKFERMLAAIRASDWPKAAEELSSSLWARQVDPQRQPNAGRDDRVIRLIRDDAFDYDL